MVSELFTDLATSFAIAVVAILVVCSLGLRPSSAGSVAIAVPVSLSVGSIALPFTGVELSQISLIGFIIVLAILVDDGIVVNENIERKLREGSSPKEAAWTGTREVLVSVITSTVIIVFTFFPILFLPGGAGEFILPLPVVVISTIIASTFVSLLVIPIFRKWKEGRNSVSTERRPAGLIGPLLEKMSNIYSQRLMKGVIKHPFVVGLGGLLLGTAGFALIPWIPLELFPDSDREEVFIEASLEDGTPLEETQAYAQEMADWVSEEPFVQSVTSYTGTNIPELLEAEGSSEESENLANFLIYIDKDEIDARSAMDRWNEELPEAFGELQTYEVSIIESGPPVGAPIAIEIAGESISELMEKSDEAQQILADTEGVENVNDDVGSLVDSYRLEPDRDMMEEHQLDSSEISEALAVLEEGVPVGEFERDGELLDWRMTYQGNPLELLDEVTITGADDEAIALSDIVTVNEEMIQPRIPHMDGERTVMVTAFPGERSEEDIIDDAEDQLMNLEEDGYTPYFAPV
ncbi:efflux RND transporter permease subunit [Salicibibacter halophilus]|uniref:Efflux RND transporter permease subunit n=1 Tax=Salicibibacter halophilus TaxID=2502791 RepID=A0A514LFW0_9BACI|nr:efflux RND transporter permease subunit [Salicibibacter halophilus]QDI90141.1 efflux RND transporter permease subunit [Salicibibacter halophilus]